MHIPHRLTPKRSAEHLFETSSPSGYSQNHGIRGGNNVIQPYPELNPAPTRGIVCTYNSNDNLLAPSDVERWIRLTRLAFKTAKIDVVVNTVSAPWVNRWLLFAESLDVRLSVRTHSEECLQHVPTWAKRGLLDVLLVLENNRWENALPRLEHWKKAEVPLRIEWVVRSCGRSRWQEALSRFRDYNVRRVDIVLTDPLIAPHAQMASPAPLVPEIFQEATEFAEALHTTEIECNLLDIPFCAVGEASRPFVVNSPQRILEHGFYEQASHALAVKIFNMGTLRARLVLQMLLGQYASYGDPIDRKLLPWILDHPWIRARVLAAKKLSRLLPWFSKSQEPVPPAASAPRTKTTLPEECRLCALRRICDHADTLPRTVRFERRTVQGERVVDPLTYRTRRIVYQDAVDQERQKTVTHYKDLVEEARRVISSRPPDIQVGSLDYRIEGHWALQLPDSVRWFSISHTEKTSTPLARLQPPFTLTASFGSGIADFIGFSFGRHRKILTPMTAFSHQLTLHVAKDGRYVFLRDNIPVSPTIFSGLYYVPERLNGVLEPALSIWNIDDVIGTQGIGIWVSSQNLPAPNTVKYSVIIVCARYARRLQAALLNLAHQQGIPLNAIEVIVAYIPGLDAVEDVLNSIEKVCPSLRIVRAPFSSEDAAAKGFLINESVKMASGEWIVLLDADILLPPTWFAAMENVPENVSFVIPDGRKMLSPDITARILLGFIHPWMEWESLINAQGEYRRVEVDGTPIGYCQCVRKHCFDQVQYEEMQHFEGADWRFGKEIREKFGRELRLSGIPVIHLDHGGSHWYGSATHW